MSGDAATRPDLPAATKDCGCGPLEPCKAHLGAGDLQDWESRARAAEAKLAALGEYVRSRPSWIVDPVESRLRKDAILAIIGSEEAPDGR